MGRLLNALLGLTPETATRDTDATVRRRRNVTRHWPKKSPRKRYHNGGPLRLGCVGEPPAPSRQVRVKGACSCKAPLPVANRIDGHPLHIKSRICTRCWGRRRVA